MRLLLVGAFAHPHAQGSQVYFQEQAIALRAAGAEIHLLTYGPGKRHRAGPARPEAPDASTAEEDSGDRRRALAGLPHTIVPGWAAPTSRRSGPHSGKPLADLALAFALRRTLRSRAIATASNHPSDVASSSASSSVRTTASIPSSNPSRINLRSAPGSARPRGSAPFDAILAHHAEAALVALHTLPQPRPPIVYCAHTLLEEELPEYFKPSLSKVFFESSTTGCELEGAGGNIDDIDDEAQQAEARSSFRSRVLASIGRVIDHRIARQCDGWIALTQASNRVMSRVSRAPGRRIAPPIADPELDPEHRNPAAVARAHGLVPGGFFLYAGNLDPYQDLDLLERIAGARRRQESTRRRGGSPCDERFPIVIATHDERAHALAARVAAAGGSDLRICSLRSSGEGQALVAAARACLVPRRTVGGFPIKLANSLAAGVPVVALHGEEWGIEDGRDSLIGDLATPVRSFARALERLEGDPALAARLAAGARATYRAQHRPELVAGETLELIESVLSKH